MSRRLFATFALVVATSWLAACAESITAPQPPTFAPSTPRLDTLDPSTCRGGFIMSEGRCA
jgi:hypothetical protein